MRIAPIIEDSWSTLRRTRAALPLEGNRMTIPKDEPGEVLPDLEFIRIKDSGGSRSGIDRRQTPGENDSPENRSGRDRRRGFDRRAGIDRRRTNDRRLSGSFWEGEIIERRELFRKKQGE
jgi:hypothetical protein